MHNVGLPSPEFEVALKKPKQNSAFTEKEVNKDFLNGKCTEDSL